MLSARGPWEPEALKRFQPDQEDVGSEKEEFLAHIEPLDNGEAKPIVTLIDFPQLVSMHHPNAKALYARDTQLSLEILYS
jgi:hypothetical protein